MSALEDLRKMRPLFGHGLEYLEVASGDVSARITNQIHRQVTRIMMPLGSLDGKLEGINLHSTQKAIIWESISGHAVPCSFSKEQLDLVKELLTSRVRVSGTVQYFTNGLPKSITNTTEIVAAAPSKILPKAGYGTIPELTNGRDSLELLAELRGESLG